jgi:hypothetical protein
LWYFDIDRSEPCPRCGKPCQWVARTTIYSRGPFSSGTLHGPLCPCPDTHIREAIADALAEALWKDVRERLNLELLDASEKKDG